MQTTMDQTYADRLAERKETRDGHLRALANERPKLKVLADRLKHFASLEEKHRKRVEVLERHARQGSEEARMALSRESDLHSAAGDERTSTQHALASVTQRIADYEDAIKRMDEEKIDAPADRAELDAVLAEMRVERQ